MELLKEIKKSISRETLTKFRYFLVIVWILCGTLLFKEFSGIEIKESSLQCDVTGDNDKDFIRECYHQYIENHNLGIPHDLFILVNVSLIPIVTMLYSCYVKSTVNRLKRSHQDAEGEPRNLRGSCRLVIAYLFQLVVCFALAITFIVLLATHLHYPINFPCSTKKVPVKFLLNRTQSTDLFTCHYDDKVDDPNFWPKTAMVVNGIFAIFTFLEILWILWRAKNGKQVMCNGQFYADILKSNSDDQRQAQLEVIPSQESQHPAFITIDYSEQPENSEIVITLEQGQFYADNLESNSDDQRQAQLEPIPLLQLQHQAAITTDYSEQPENSEIPMTLEHPEHAQAQKSFKGAIKALKENCLEGTEQLSDLKQPFGRPEPGEGYIHDLTMDEIYVNVAILEGTAHHYFAKNQDRLKQLKQYPPHAEDCHFAKPQDIIDKEHTNVLVVGRPTIGKTSLSTKILRLWACGKAFNGDYGETSTHFDVVFLLKFRRFNDNAELSLRELLARAETVQSLDDLVWDFIIKEPTNVLLIFDGVDEYSRKEDIKALKDVPTYKNNVEEKMPVSFLYNKLAAGKLLRGASILTTTTPTAVQYVAHVNFQRTVEILGFTSENVEDYVQRFSQDVTGAKEKIWEHIKSNANLFSLCYIPMNCFLICHCLLQIILSESSQALPTKITGIYKMIVKMVLLHHNRESWSTETYEPFEMFPEELQEILYGLGEIAFRGTEEGRLLFESSEVSGLEGCGLLHKLPDQKRRALDEPSKSQFCFTHLTVQEFFAAKHLVDRAKTDEEEIEEFVCTHIKDGTWQVVLQFVAGLLKSSTDIFIKLLPESTATTTDERSSKPETLTSWPATREDRDLAVQVCKCLYEINDEQQQLLQNKIEKIKFNAVEFRDCSLAPIDLAAVLHFLENAEEVLCIDLSYNEVRNLGAKEVKNFIVNRERKLKRLNLSSNGLTDKAANDLAAALQQSNCKLEWLDLSDNHFTDNAAMVLASALGHSNLEALYLSGNNFADDAAKHFAAAFEHSKCKLKLLDLRGHNFTKKGRQYLTAAEERSNCMVFLSKD